LLRQTGASLPTLAVELDVTPDFLVELSSHATLLPPEVKRELATRAHRALDLELELAMASLEAPVEMQRAASRESAFSGTRVTYEDLVRQSQLSVEQKNYWLQLGRQGPPGEKKGVR
jgi:hypothetical protein